MGNQHTRTIDSWVSFACRVLTFYFSDFQHHITMICLSEPLPQWLSQSKIRMRSSLREPWAHDQWHLCFFSYKRRWQVHWLYLWVLMSYVDLTLDLRSVSPCKGLTVDEKDRIGISSHLSLKHCLKLGCVSDVLQRFLSRNFRKKTHSEHARLKSEKHQNWWVVLDSKWEDLVQNLLELVSEP